MDKYLFSGKLICGYCGWSMRGKMDRQQKIYVCSKYNKNKQCIRNPIKEKYLIENIDIDNTDKIVVKDGKVCNDQIKIQ